MKPKSTKQIEFKFDATARQAEAWRAFFDPDVLEVLYGGAKGGGKSYLLCVLFYTLSLMIIKEHSLQPTDKPIHWSWMGRKVGSDFVSTTLDTWQRFIPADCYRICGSSDIHPRHILIWDRIAIDFGGLDSVQAINKFNSAEYAVIGVDQAEETTKDDIAVLMGSRRLMINGKPWLTYNGVPMGFKGLWTANPAQCWLKEEFIDDPKPGYKFVKALPSDNHYLPEGYEEVTLQNAFGHQPELLKAYRYGDWNVISSFNQVIQSDWIEAAKLRTLHSPTHKLLLNVSHLPHVSCDTARYGDDQTVIYEWDHLKLVNELVSGHTSVVQVAKDIVTSCRRCNAKTATIESTGSDLGAGAIDIIEDTARDIEVVVFCPQGKALTIPLDPHTGKPVPKYANLRAEVWDYAATQFSEGNIDLDPNVDPELTRQLTWPRYYYKGGKMLIESKDDIKDRMKRSPDKADAYVMGIWGSQFAKKNVSANRLTVQKIREFNRKYA